LEQQLQATRIAFEVERHMTSETLAAGAE